MSIALVVYGSTQGTLNADTNATGNTVAQRDNAGGLTAVAMQAATVTSTGPVAVGVGAATTTKTLDATAGSWMCNATGAGFTVTLPAASACAGRKYTIKKIDSSGNVVTVGVTGGDTIDGAATKTLTAQYQKIVVQSDGSTWWVIG